MIKVLLISCAVLASGPVECSTTEAPGLKQCRAMAENRAAWDRSDRGQAGMHAQGLSHRVVYCRQIEEIAA